MIVRVRIIWGLNTWAAFIIFNRWSFILIMADVMASTSVDLIIGIETIDTNQRLAVIHTIIGAVYTVFTIIATTLAIWEQNALRNFLVGYLKNVLHRLQRPSSPSQKRTSLTLNVSCWSKNLYWSCWIHAPLGARAYPWILSKYFPCVCASVPLQISVGGVYCV